MPKNKGQGAGTPGTFDFNYAPPPGALDYSKTGLNLGLSRAGRSKFHQAVAGGTLQDFLNANPHLKARFEKGRPGSYRGDLAQRYLQTSAGNVTNQPAVAPPPAVNTAGVPGPSPGPPAFDYNKRNELINQFRSPQSEIYNAYMRSFERGGPLDIPSFQEMYGSWRDVAEQELNRQTGALNEALGARGARYSSDILSGQGELRQNLARDLRNKAAEYQTQLRGLQFQELQPIGQAQQASYDTAMARMMQQYLAQTAPPPLFAGQPPQYQQPTTVIY
jgi:hypothetical protein